MSSIARHIQIKLKDSRVIAPTPQERRIVSRVIFEQARHDNLLAFGLADTHLHLESACSESRGGQLARRVEISLSRRLRLDVGFVRDYDEPIKTEGHLYTAFKYVLSQPYRHVPDLDPFFEGSNLPDLLGLRVIGLHTAETVRRLLPRVNRKFLLDHLKVPCLEPADGPIEVIPIAGMMAAGLMNLRGSSDEVKRTLCAIIHVVGNRLTAGKLGCMLGVNERTVRRYRAQIPDRRLEMAIRLQLGLMQLKGIDVLRPKLVFGRSQGIGL